MLHYNENKAAEGEAQLIMASGFAADIEGLNFNQKLSRFKHLQELKPDVKTNAMHISLNFHSSERLTDALLQEIAGNYMEQIGFGDQPFLVYRHDDAAHLHVHIVTTNIRADGERIDLNNIGKDLSEPARKAIEAEYNLVRAESRLFKTQSGIKPADPVQARYGRLPTKRAISNVITAVARDYKFSSLAEYNAVLKGFNVAAIRGAEHTAMFEKKGLMYTLLDKGGHAIGVPVKASSFYSKPTLRSLEKKFERNAEKRKQFKVGLKLRIDNVLENVGPLTREKFEQDLKKHGIDALFRENEQGQVFGITFVDHNSKTVFNGSDLGKGYSAKGVAERFGQVVIKTENDKPKTVQTGRKEQSDRYQPDHNKHQPDTKGLLEILLEQPMPDYGMDILVRRKKRKKKGRVIGTEISI